MSSDAGFDGFVAAMLESVGHNCRQETTTFTLILMVKVKINIRLIADGGRRTRNWPNSRIDS